MFDGTGANSGLQTGLPMTAATSLGIGKSAPLRAELCVEDNPPKLSSFTQLIGCANTQT
jgi:hypothetical protein